MDRDEQLPGQMDIFTFIEERRPIGGYDFIPRDKHGECGEAGIGIRGESEPAGETSEGREKE